MQLKEKGIRVLGIDFNPSAIKHWKSLGLDCEYGDSTDAEFIIDLPLNHASWVVSSIPHIHTGLSSEDNRKTVIQLTRSAGYTGKLAAVSQSRRDTEELNLLGVELILEPFQDTADRAVKMLFEGINSQSSNEKRGI
ncbi:NAD-binding protein [Thalassotalea profundi]|nr:NAD-binding protein [Thalassotalea profundi]